jgi:flagellar assembly factor FliW
MPIIRVQGTDLAYEEKDIIRFDEGLIGMPHLRRMVLINQTDIAPFLLLCSLDDSQLAFLVLEALAHFPGYTPRLPDGVGEQLGITEGERPLLLVTVIIAPEWLRSTINLRAPIVVAPSAMRGRQVVLTDSTWKLAEPLPLAWAVATA